MLKTLLAGAAAVMIAGSPLAQAQDKPAAPTAAERDAAGARDTGPRRGLSAEDALAYADARIAALKAGLRLTPEQEKNWPAVESALRDLAKARFERMQARRDAWRDRDRSRDPIESLRLRADQMAVAAAGLKRLAEAGEPLYKSLDDGQKRRMSRLTREAAWEGRGRGDHRRGHRWRGEDRRWR
jgi:hypothetical protein